GFPAPWPSRSARTPPPGIVPVGPPTPVDTSARGPVGPRVGSAIDQPREQGLLHDPLGGERVVPRLCFGEGVGVENVEGPMHTLEERDRLLRRLHAVLPERELVQLPDALPVVLPQRVEELE